MDNVEVEDGVACYAAPVLDFRGVSVAAILSRQETLVPLVASTASALSRRLGHVERAREEAGRL